MNATDSDSGPHAVRWFRRVLRSQFREDWTRWHWTENGDFTRCGNSIPLGIEGGSMFPDTDDEMARVDCRRCLSSINK
jgi:hypothetical protein